MCIIFITIIVNKILKHISIMNYCTLINILSLNVKVLFLSFIFSCLWLSGCLSGRGQAEVEGGRPDRPLVQQMEEHYSSLPVRLPETNPEVQRLYQDWLDGHDSPCAQQCLHTQYKNHTQPPSQIVNPDIQWWLEVIIAFPHTWNQALL